ncbi:MAG: winged helix DNA-binding protein [Clostridia bacterium]|nr:winged helix DNA-binding protein [Clostridia bacterium]
MDFLTCLLIDCAKKAKNNLTKALQEYNITCRQAVVLRALSQVSITAKEIGENTAIDKATLSAMLQKMIENGLILSHSSDKDGREKIYSLTEEGNLLLPKVNAVEEQFRKQVFGNLEKEEYERLSGLLVTLKENL